jgi:hypothetical protein
MGQHRFSKMHIGKLKENETLILQDRNKSTLTANKNWLKGKPSEKRQVIKSIVLDDPFPNENHWRQKSALWYRT